MLTEACPREELAFLPTPLREMPRLRAALGPNCPRLFVKRDDQTGLATGGNKTRKLEFLLADAKRKGADTVITAGAAQSNHCRQTAAAAVLLGLQCVLVLGGEQAPRQEWKGNLLMDGLFGAEIVWTVREKRNEVLAQTTKALQEKGHIVYDMPLGGSTSIGAVGYVHAFEETVQQLEKRSLQMDRIIVSTSTGGTQAGLVVGAAALNYRCIIEGMSNEPDDDMQTVIYQLAKETAEILSLEATFSKEDIIIPEGIGKHPYAQVQKEEIEAIRLFAETEAIILDPVYTARAANEMIQRVRSGVYGADESLLFWHTGGVGAVLHQSGLLS